jgi:hypothetical protein
LQKRTFFKATLGALFALTLFALGTESAAAVASPASPGTNPAAAGFAATPGPQAPSPNPCRHRVFCGPIHLLPRTAAEWQRAGAQIASALVENAAFNAARRQSAVVYPILDGTGTHTVFTSLSGTSNVRPFFGALAQYAMADTIFDTELSVLHFRPDQRAFLQRVAAIGAVADAVQTAPIFKAQRVLQRTAAKCEEQVTWVNSGAYAAHFGLISARLGWLGGPGATFEDSALVDGAVISGAGDWSSIECAQTGGAFRYSALPSLPALRAEHFVSAIIPPAVTLGSITARVTFRAVRDIGPIRLLPRDRTERNAFLANAALTLIDGIVTQHHVHGQTWREGDRFVRPFAHNFADLILGWTASELATQIVTRHWSSESRAKLDALSAEDHLLGIESWDAPFESSLGASHGTPTIGTITWAFQLSRPLHFATKPPVPAARLELH